MGTFARRELPDLIQQLLAEAPQYGFYQSIRILEEAWYGHGTLGNGLDEWLRIRPAPEISFPAADIRRCEFAEDGKLDLELNFMGLYGVDAPVPSYITEFIARDDETSEVMRGFLDIFCQRLYTQTYLSWKKYRPVMNLEEESCRYIKYLMALSGNAVSHTDATELGFSGSMGARVRSASGLEGMLSEFMGNVPVKVRQFVPRWVRLEQDAHLGGETETALMLGDNTILGDEVLDVSGKIDIYAGPMNANDAKALLPGSVRAQELYELLKRYLDPTLSYDLVIEVTPTSIIAQCLGEEDIILGWTSWLGSKISDHYELRIPGESLSVIKDEEVRDDGRMQMDMKLVA